MAAKRVILELGTGNDLHGGDYTKAAVRAVHAECGMGGKNPDANGRSQKAKGKN